MEGDEMARILHITDVHAGWTADEQQEQAWWDNICKAIVSVVTEQPVDIVVATGDFCKRGSQWEFARAEMHIRQLMERLGMGMDRLFMCRGNHDTDTADACSTFTMYEDSEKRLYGAEMPKQGTCVKCEDGECQMFWLNTCSETSYVDFDDAVIIKEEIDTILDMADEDKTVVVLMHHQPEILPDQTQLERLGQCGKVACVFSGHLHCYTRRYEWKGMTVVNGMPLMPHLGFIPVGFQIMEVSKDGGVNGWKYVIGENGSYQTYKG